MPLDVLATELGVSRAWLGDEVKAGRIPHLQAGGRRLFDVNTVRRALVQRALANVDSGEGGGKGG